MVTLQELLTRTALQNADVFYNAATVGGLPICGADDTQARRLLVDPNRTSVYFPQVADISPTTTFLDIDDGLYRQILTATGGFRYQLSDERGRPLPGTGIVHLCRSQAPTAGRYPVFVTDNAILNNAPRHPNLMDQLVGIRLSDAEVIGLVRGSGMLDTSQYAVSQDPTGLFFVAHNRTLATNLSDWLETNPTAHAIFTNETRRGEIIRAIRANIEADEYQFMGIRWGARWQPIVAAVGSLAAVASIGGMVYMARLMKEQMKLMTDTMRGGLQDGESALSKYGRDLTRMAREGRLPPVLGREAEMRQLTNILGKRQVANPLLVGPPGSGKSAIVEGFAQQVVRGQIKGLDQNLTRVIEISQEGLKEGAGVVGQYEARVRAVLNEIGVSITDDGKVKTNLKPGERIILFVDEMHNANREPAKGTPSLLAQLKPALSRGGISLVGATTNEELHILTSPDGRQDSATGRRFDIINISAMTSDQALDLLVRNRASYETDGIRINDAAFREAVVLTDNFKPQQHFPDKSIQLIDLVVSTARNEGITNITADYVRRIFSASSGLTEAAMTLELQLRAEETQSRAAHVLELRTTATTEFLRSHNVADARMPAAVAEAIRLWEALPEAEKNVYISHEANYREGAIPNRFLARILVRLRTVTAVNRPVTANQVPTAPPANPLAEAMTYPVNDAAIEAALRRADPALADYYRTNLSNAAAPVTTFGELAQRIVAVDPRILSQANRALTAEGLSLAQAPERFIFEVVTRAAAARGGWTPPNPTELPARMAAFETEVRGDRGVERRAADPADTARREAEERARREAERRGRP